MSLKYVEDKIDAIRERSNATRARAQAQRAAIMSDSRLSSEGKAEAIEALREPTNATISALRLEEDKLINDKIVELERTVVGTVGSDPAAVINYRDAQDRAERLTSAVEADLLMTRALRSDDKTLAAAVARVSMERNFKGVADAFAAENPSLIEATRDLSALEGFRSDVGRSFERAMIYSTEF